MSSRSLRLALTLVLLVPFGQWITATAAEPPPDVYQYLENPELIGENQQPHHAELRPYADTAAALEATREPNTRWTRSLDGDWRIRMADHPRDVPKGFHQDGYDTSGWRTVKIPHTWQTDGLDHPIFRNIPTEMWPDDPPRIPRDVNPTGAYVRQFDLPADWRERSTYLRFEGVTSAYFVWVNGQYAGYDQGGYLPAEFDISKHLRPGRNTVALQVHRWSAGSHLEDYDQWRFAGIFRSVWMYSTPKTHLQDVTLKADLDAAYRDADFSVETETVGDLTGHQLRATLYDPRKRKVATLTGAAGTKLTQRIPNPAKWTDETPNVYRVVLELLDPQGRPAHVTSQPFGFRKIEIKDKVLLINGRRVLFKGTNRAETDPETGRHATQAQMLRDVRLMKQFNLNAVRTSHYPSDPAFYDLADQHGLWIDDEMEVETHHHDGCPDNCLAERPEWQDAFVERFTGMVERDKNHPSVFLWDTGNEAGLGRAHYTMAEWATKNDPSRPLYHQSNGPDGDAPFAHVWGPRYPSPAGLEAQAQRTEKPIIMGEYAHASGNGFGNFKEFWDVVRKYPQVQGGFIWDWAEQNIHQPLKTTPDASGNNIMAWLSGLPEQVEGKQGKGLYLSSLDDWVEVYRDPVLDEVSNGLTLDLWVKPDTWTGDFTMIAKGNQQYAVKMADERTLEFFVYGDSGWHTVRATVPADWRDNWHRVSGTFDGSALRLLVDGKEVGRTSWTGTISASAEPVNIGRNPAAYENPSTRPAHGVFDNVRIYHRALTEAELAADPKDTAVLALDFDEVTAKGRYLSHGAGPGGVDGLVSPDRTPQPETAQLAWVHAPIRFSGDARRVHVTNERSFLGTDDLLLRWSVREGKRVLASGLQPLDIPANTTGVVQLPAPPPNPDSVERWLDVQAVLAKPTKTLRAGHVVSHGQFAAGGNQVRGLHTTDRAGKLTVRDSADQTVVTGRDFRYTFSRKSGTLTSMKVRGRELLTGGPKLDAWRAPVYNEMWGEGNEWRSRGLDRLVTTVGDYTVSRANGEATIVIRSTATGTPAASFEQAVTYTVTGSGEVRIHHRVDPRGEVRTLPYLARIGLQLKVPDDFQRFSWYGRGPVENYNDRNDGTPVGVYSSTVEDQYFPYTQPQDYGNHDDVRWATLTDGRTGGLLVAGDLNVAVDQYDQADRAAYPHALKRNTDGTTLHLSHAVTGVSETFHEPIPKYQVNPDAEFAYSLLLRPLDPAEVKRGLPNDQLACRPDAALTTAEPQVEPGETIAVQLTVTNHCRTPLRATTATLDAPVGWAVEPTTVTIGDLAAGQSSSTTVRLTRSAGTPRGTRPVTAEVTATNGTTRVSTLATTHLTAVPPAPRGTVSVSSLEFLTAENGWGPVERDRSNGEQGSSDGNPLRINDKTYPTGIGAHADSTIETYLGGACSTFTAELGIDDEVGQNGSVEFEVQTDDTSKYRSTTLTGADDAVPITVDVSGAKVLRLKLHAASNGNAHDHADWAAAMLQCNN